MNKGEWIALMVCIFIAGIMVGYSWAYYVFS